MHEFTVCLAFLEVSFFLDTMTFMARSKPYHTPFPRMTTTTEPSEDGGLKLSVIYFCIRKAGNENNVTERSRWPMSYHSRSDDLRGLNLFIYSHICRNEAFLMLAAALLYGPQVAAATPYIPLPTRNTEGLGTYLQITSRFPTMTKVTVDPSLGQGVKRQVFLTVELLLACLEERSNSHNARIKAAAAAPGRPAWASRPRGAGQCELLDNSAHCFKSVLPTVCLCLFEKECPLASGR